MASLVDKADEYEMLFSYPAELPSGSVSSAIVIAIAVNIDPAQSCLNVGPDGGEEFGVAGAQEISSGKNDE